MVRTFHRCFIPSFGSFGQAVSEEKIFFRNLPVTNKNCLWRPCLLRDRNKMGNLYRGHSIDVSYQVSVHLDAGFERRRLKREKLTDDGCQVMAKTKINSCQILIMFVSVVTLSWYHNSSLVGIFIVLHVSL